MDSRAVEGSKHKIFKTSKRENVIDIGIVFLIQKNVPTNLKKYFNHIKNRVTLFNHLSWPTLPNKV